MRFPLLLLAVVVSFATPARAGEKRELLSRHDTVAEFTGLRFHRCRGLTSLCPNQCGESGNLAVFRILKYLAYDKPGEYGDPQQTELLVLVDNTLGEAKLPAAQAAAIRQLQVGDRVRLAWRHDYVTNNSGAAPERPLTQVSKLTAAEAAQLVGPAQADPPKPAAPPKIAPTPF